MPRIAVVLVAACIAMTSAVSMVSAQVVLRAGHINQPNSPLGLAFDKFAELVEQKTGGEVTVEIFPASQLGPIDAMFDDLSVGSLDVMIELLEWYGRWDKRFGVFGLPYLFRDRDHLRDFLADDYFRTEMIGALEEQLNARFLVDRITWHQQLDRTLLCNRPVFHPDDLSGQTLRMFQSRIPVLSWETLGASIQIIPWAETYTALATGTVDCVTARVEAHYAMNQTEVAKFITVTEEYYQAYVPVISQNALTRLNDEQTRLVEEAAYEAGEWFADYTASVQRDYEQRVREEHGASIIYPPLEPWRTKIEPAYSTFEDEGEIPEGMVERVRSVQ